MSDSIDEINSVIARILSGGSDVVEGGKRGSKKASPRKHILSRLRSKLEGGEGTDSTVAANVTGGKRKRSLKGRALEHHHKVMEVYRELKRKYPAENGSKLLTQAMKTAARM